MFCMCENLPQRFASVLPVILFFYLFPVTYIYSPALSLRASS